MNNPYIKSLQGIRFPIYEHNTLAPLRDADPDFNPSESDVDEAFAVASDETGVEIVLNPSFEEFDSEMDRLYAATAEFFHLDLYDPEDSETAMSLIAGIFREIDEIVESVLYWEGNNVRD